MDNCPFCAPEIEKFSFLSSDNFLAIYNRSPILPGHSLIIPRHHYESLLELSPSLIPEMMSFSIEAVRLLMRTYNAEAFDWTIQDGWAAGQTVPHLHLHLIPRKTGDLPYPGDWFPELEKTNPGIIDSDQRFKLTDEEIISIVEFIRKKAEE
jgi:bis(5'-adenosyl)-triphosphatase